MAKKTLLEMTQNILSAMDSDEVNSIGDTVEALQVAEVVRETYELMTVNVDIPGKAGLVKLDGASDPDRPNILKAPAEVQQVEWVRYNNILMEYLEPDVFLDFIMKRIVGAEGTIQVDGLTVRLDKSPQYYTSFNDEELFFDSIDSSENTTLVQNKATCWAQLELPFEMADEFVPTLPPHMFPRLLSEAKASCFINFKQVSNAKEEQRSRQQKVSEQNNRHRIGTLRPEDRLPDYGRRGSGRSLRRRGGAQSGNTVPVEGGASFDYSAYVGELLGE